MTQKLRGISLERVIIESIYSYVKMLTWLWLSFHAECEVAKGVFEGLFYEIEEWGMILKSLKLEKWYNTQILIADSVLLYFSLFQIAVPWQLFWLINHKCPMSINPFYTALVYVDTSSTRLKISLITKSLGDLTTKESNASVNCYCLY